MKKHRNLTLALVLLFAVPVFATEGRMPKGSMQQMGRNKAAGKQEVAQRLGLTQEQQDKLQNLHEAYKEKFRKLHEELREARKKMKDRLSSGDFNLGQMDAVINAVVSAQKKMLQLRVEYAYKLKEILGVEKYKQLQRIRASHRNRRKNRSRKNNGPAGRK